MRPGLQRSVGWRQSGGGPGPERRAPRGPQAQAGAGVGAGDTAPSLPGLTFPRGTGAKGWVLKKLRLRPRPLPAPAPRFLKAGLLVALALGETVAPLHSAGSVKAGGATQCRGGALGIAGKWGEGQRRGRILFLSPCLRLINRASPARLRPQDLGGLCLSLVKEKHFQEQGYMEAQETFLDAATERYRSRVFLHLGSRESTQGGRDERCVALFIAHQKRARLQNVPGALPTPLFRQHVTVALMPCGFSERPAGLRARDGC